WLCAAGCASAGRGFAGADQRREFRRSDAGFAAGGADEGGQQCAIGTDQAVANGSEPRFARRRERCWHRCRRWISGETGASPVRSRGGRAGVPGAPPNLERQGGHSLKHAIKLAGVAVSMVALASLALCQEAKVYREGGNWVQEMTGDLGAAKNLRVKLAAGSVRVQGGAQAGITYVIHRRAYTSSEQQARREFESYRISTSLKGDTAWIVAESSRRDAKCADDFVISVPRGLESAKIETGGGSVNATGVAGRVDLSSGGGNIHLDDIGGEVTAETGGGSIEVGS